MLQQRRLKRDTLRLQRLEQRCTILQLRNVCHRHPLKRFATSPRHQMEMHQICKRGKRIKPNVTQLLRHL